METVNKIKTEINRLQSLKSAIEKGIKNKYIPKLEEEIRNFLDGVGEGFIDGDYYAPDRYYSDIPFIKNIRWGTKWHYNNDEIIGSCKAIEIKLLSPAGELLPDQIEIDGETLPIVFSYSKNYQREIDY